MVDGNHVDVSPEQLRIVAGILGGAKSKIHSVIVKYDTDTAALGPVWGEDRFGIEFANIYLPTRESIIETGYTVVDGISEIENRLYHNAETWERTDEINRT